ncbi:MAG: molybdopterin molybdenumtransferase MoeA [Firmicutes bacterium HGW-Firmicutes-1]|jgi:molybdopterin molybdotransferase|nr:MAG: molybdopterin molybdenumtransferase MoeA [Firmicutes bacterium HGW-Firmicutes-1]
MEFFNVLTVKEVNLIIDRLSETYIIGTEEVDLINAVDRITVTDYYARVNLPEFNRSTVDGYAVICQDVMGASDAMPSFLLCVSEVNMGESTDLCLQKGQAVYVPTGGMVPRGADGMVMIEYVQKLDEQTILIQKPIAPGENITLIGDDLQEGDMIAPKGKKLSAYDIGLFAATGTYKVQVYNKPKFAILSTGDEIIDYNETQKLGQIREVNGYALNALILQLGGEVIKKVIVRDDFRKLQDELSQAMEQADIVLISGGSSVGTRDYTKQVIESFDGGRVLVHGISIKPGKPTIIGQIDAKLVFGLPGHPAAALMVFHIFVKRYMQKILKRVTNTFHVRATLDSNVHSSPGKETYQMVQLIRNDHEWNAIPLYGKSGMMSLLTRASGYIRISDNQEGLMKGEQVDVYLLQEVEL